MPQATILYAGLLTLIYIRLIFSVISARREHRQLIGAKDNQESLLRAIRAHGNFSEYTPLFLILLFLEESSFHTEWACYALGGLFLIGRLSHAHSLLKNETRELAASSPLGRVLRFRFMGMVCTFMPLGIFALMLLVQWGLFQYARVAL